MNKHYVLQQQVFKPRYACTLLRSLCFHSIDCTCINCRPPSYWTDIVHLCIVLIKVMIKPLLVVSLFELQIINSIILIFIQRQKRTETLKFGASKSSSFGYIPLPRFNLVPTIHIYFKNRCYLHTKTKFLATS